MQSHQGHQECSFCVNEQEEFLLRQKIYWEKDIFSLIHFSLSEGTGHIRDDTQDLCLLIGKYFAGKKFRHQAKSS